MTYVTCRLTAKNRNQLRNPTLGKRVRATFTFLTSYWKQECRRLSCYRRIKAGAWRNANFQYTILDTAATVEDKLKRISLKCSRSCRDQTRLQFLYFSIHHICAAVFSTTLYVTEKTGCKDVVTQSSHHTRCTKCSSPPTKKNQTINFDMPVELPTITGPCRVIGPVSLSVRVSAITFELHDIWPIWHTPV